MSTNTTNTWRWRDSVMPDEKINTADSSEWLRPLYGDAELSDIIMEGSDGGKVIAIKAILGVRSSVFRKLFFGAQRSTKSVSPGGKEYIILKEWDCCILHLLVEFCYTDDISMMEGEPSDWIARVMVNLKSASKAFDLQILSNKVDQWSSKQVKLFPALACALIDEGIKENQVDEKLLETIRLKSKAALLPRSNAVGTGVSSLSEPALLFVLRTLEDSVSNPLLVEIIKRWSEVPSKDCGSKIKLQRRNSCRKNFANKCTLRFVNVRDSCGSQNSEVSSLTLPFMR